MLTLCPAMEGYMTLAWAGALLAAIETPAVLAQYREDTGDHWQPGRTPIDRMVDDATGREWMFVEAFTKWFNANVWGD